MSGLAAQSSVPRKASEASLDSPLQSPEVPTNIPMSPISESKTVSAPTFSSAETPSPSHPPPTTKRKPPRLSLTPHLHLNPSDFLFGITLGEGAYARVVHARTKKGQEDFAVKIMEKRHIKKENKGEFLVSFLGLIFRLVCILRMKFLNYSRPAPALPYCASSPTHPLTHPPTPLSEIRNDGEEAVVDV